MNIPVSEAKAQLTDLVRRGRSSGSEALLDMDQSLVHIPHMNIPVSEAKAQLTDLVRRAEAGDDIVLTRHGHPAVRLVPVTAVPDAATRDALLDALRDAGAKAKPGPSAARSADFLYGDDGLPK